MWIHCAEKVGGESRTCSAGQTTKITDALTAQFVPAPRASGQEGLPLLHVHVDGKDKRFVDRTLDNMNIRSSFRKSQ